MNLLYNLGKVLILVLMIGLFFGAASAATTEVTIEKYTAEGILLNTTTVDYQWMEAHLPVVGDGITHYYLQGPVFEGDLWDPTESVNVETKDMGAFSKELLSKISVNLSAERPRGIRSPLSPPTDLKRPFRRSTSIIPNLRWALFFSHGTAKRMGMFLSITPGYV